MLAPPEQRSLAQIGIDGLLLSGGTDVDPQLYGQDPAPEALPGLRVVGPGVGELAGLDVEPEDPVTGGHQAALGHAQEVRQLHLLGELFVYVREPRSVSELVAATGIPQATVSREVARLEDAGLLRDLTGSAAAPLFFAAGTVVLTAVASGAFRWIERGSRRA